MVILSKHSDKYGKDVKVEESGGTYWLIVDGSTEKYSTDKDTIIREYDSY